MRCCATTIFASSRTRRVVAVWEITVDERDRHSQREGKTTRKDNPPSVKRMCRVSLVAIPMLLHGQRCSGATSPMQSREEARISRKRFRVPHGATILPLLSGSICDSLLSKNNLKNSGHDKVVDRILCVWFCGPKKSRFFGSQSCPVRDGRSKRSVLKLKTKPKNQSEDEIGRFTPSDWSNRDKEAQETGWARFRFYFV